eukprot:GHVU01177772.1.p1 GENE.GHVU01177772.1~~GHVU01177772.1.p1  ORF type:complete len:108 (+),score=8.74 GHVU01177772.1:65-388(+)
MNGWMNGWVHLRRETQHKIGANEIADARGDQIRAGRGGARSVGRSRLSETAAGIGEGGPSIDRLNQSNQSRVSQSSPNFLSVHGCVLASMGVCLRALFAAHFASASD